jgi:transposase
VTFLDPRDARIAELEAQLAAKDARIAQLEALLAQALSRIAELERQVGQHSKNSSRPPSSDGPGVQRRPKSPTGRKPGGQKGHKGHYRVLVGPERVQEFKEVKPRQCRQCHGALEGEDSRPRRHQVVEVPPLAAHITEYRLHRLKCQQCGARTRAQLPAGVPHGCFGPNLSALVVFLTRRMRLSKREAREFLVEALAVSVSVGSISAVEARASAALAQVYQQAEGFVRTQPWVHMDETGWRQARQRAWLWVRATRRVSVFRVAATRSKTEAKEQLGPAFAGVAVTDRFAGYSWVDSRQRQLCWAHLVRDFEAMSQWEGLAGLVGHGLRAQAWALFDTWQRYRSGRLNAWNCGRKLAPVKRRVRGLLQLGAALAPGRPSRQCAALLKLWPALWRFTLLDGVEPTNNKAERDLRLAVLWRKGSFGTHSPPGSRFIERLLTVTASLRAQGRSVLAFLREAMRASLHSEPAPSLLPAHT